MVDFDLWRGELEFLIRRVSPIIRSWGSNFKQQCQYFQAYVYALIADFWVGVIGLILSNWMVIVLCLS